MGADAAAVPGGPRIAVLVDFAASLPHYTDHLLPIWRALAPEERGRFFTTREAAFEGATIGRPLMRDPYPVVVAGPNDLRRCGKRPVIFVEHGAGQAYSEPHVSYSGGPGRDAVMLFLCPNEVVAERNRATYPDAAVEVVGSPRVEALVAAGRDGTPLPPASIEFDGEKTRGRLPAAASKPRVVVSFHWDCPLAPESRWAYPHFAEALPEVVERFDVVGHGHPRFASWWRQCWGALRVPYVPRFEDAMAGADLYVCDNSSTLFEAAALDLPVVVMNAPWYRRGVDLFPRFWAHADVGVQVDQAGDLGDAIAWAASDSRIGHEGRRRAVGAIWGEIPGSAQRAADAIRNSLAR